MLTAKIGNEIINCYDGTHKKDLLKKWSKKKILLCPVCGKPYEYCHGEIKTPYFRHMDKAECEDRYSESETEEHINGKRDLYEWIKKQNGVTNAVLEGWISETKQRPDIMFDYRNKKYVIEYQCSPIASEYIERHELYQAVGITDIWIAGAKKYFKPNARHKFIEGHVVGYYNPSEKKYHVNNVSLYGRFYNKIVKKTFSLNFFVFNGKDVVLSTHKDKDAEKLIDVYDLRQKNRIDDEDNKNNMVFLRLCKCQKYINNTDNSIIEIEKDYNGISQLYSSYWTDIYFRTIKFYSNECNFYQKIYDVVHMQKTYKELYLFFKKCNNRVWNFTIISHRKNKFRIRISYYYYFDSEFLIEYYKLKTEDDIKEILLPYMVECYNKALIGNNYIRIMEVRHE